MLIYIKFEKRKFMPFKTKGQKLAASNRRFTISSAQIINYGFGGSEKVKTAKIPSLDKDKNLPIENFGYLRHDLAKTIFMASLIIALQLLLALF